MISRPEMTPNLPDPHFHHSQTRPSRIRDHLQNGISRLFGFHEGLGVVGRKLMACYNGLGKDWTMEPRTVGKLEKKLEDAIAEETAGQRTQGVLT